MTDILTVSGLSKAYPSFSLKNVSFSVPAGSITGFIGRNGSGKTTTLKSLVNLVHPDSGSVSYFGLPFPENESELKQSIGFSGGAVNYYQKKKLNTIADVTKSFYNSWNDSAFREYMNLFSLDGDKTPQQLSEGMKVKFNLALALSHNPKLLILDEPTSGLDPVSRDEILEILLALRDKGISVLFSTHITSDLDKCADRIIYIRSGEIIAEDTVTAFTDSYRLLRSASNYAIVENNPAILGKCRNKTDSTYLIKKESAELFSECELSVPGLEEIMIHLERGSL